MHVHSCCIADLTYYLFAVLVAVAVAVVILLVGYMITRAGEGK